jgi:Acyltransferase
LISTEVTKQSTKPRDYIVPGYLATLVPPELIAKLIVPGKALNICQPLTTTMMLRRKPLAIVSFLLLACQAVTAFTPTGTATIRRNGVRLSASIVPESVSVLEDNISQDFVLTPQQVNAIVKIGSDGKEKVINSFGLWCMAVSLVVCPIWYAALQLTEASYKLIGDDWDPNREFFDGLGKIWAKAFLSLIGSYPTFSGELELLQKGPHNQPCLFVANHASWLDIPVLCTCTDQVFKFVAKGELGKLPCIGNQLSGVSCPQLCDQGTVLSANFSPFC